MSNDRLRLRFGELLWGFGELSNQKLTEKKPISTTKSELW
jgi:hypothetical protein